MHYFRLGPHWTNSSKQASDQNQPKQCTGVLLSTFSLHLCRQHNTEVSNALRYCHRIVIILYLRIYHGRRNPRIYKISLEKKLRLGMSWVGSTSLYPAQPAGAKKLIARELSNFRTNSLFSLVWERERKRKTHGKSELILDILLWIWKK